MCSYLLKEHGCLRQEFPAWELDKLELDKWKTFFFLITAAEALLGQGS